MRTQRVIGLLAGLALGGASARLAAQAPGWAVDVTVGEGALTASDVRGVLDAHLGEVAECAPGAGPFRLVYEVSVGASGGVRSAAPDRSAGADLAPARAVRCVRHVLEELALPERAEPSALWVTFSLGESASAELPAAAPPASSPTPSAGTVTTARPGSVIGGAVLVGAISAAAGRPSATLRDVVDRGRPGLAACYATALAAAPGLGGDGALHVTIEPDGHVSRSVFAGGEALASAMAICLGAAARQWTFPVASDPARIDVALTFAP